MRSWRIKISSLLVRWEASVQARRGGPYPIVVLVSAKIEKTTTKREVADDA